MSITDTLTLLGTRIAEIRRATPGDAGPRMGADAFSVFKLFPVPNETRLSMMLGWFLDPRGSHGAGSLFLERFLSGLGAPWSGCDPTEAVVLLEAPTREIEQQDRRIDIVIDGKGMGSRDREQALGG